MAVQPSHSAAPADQATHWLWLTGTAAVVVGAVLRFNGLTVSPLADDEYYVVRSVQNILLSGLPEYACGGYYPRGLLFQYLSAGLVHLGVPLEFAPRYLAAASGMLVLPGAFLLARRIGGPIVAMLVLAWLSLSAWQVDGAQFGRMYAPFQAVFVWYCVCYLRAALDRDARAKRWLAALTVAGVLTWEGGFFLALMNLLLPFVDPERRAMDRGDWSHLAWMALLAAGAYLFATTDFRHLDPALVYPAGFESVETMANPGWREVPAMQGPLQQRQWLWAAAGAAPLGLTGLALVRLWQDFRDRWLAVAGLLVTMAAAAVHQFAVVALVLALLLALGLLRWADFRTRAAGLCAAATALWLLAWTTYGLTAAGWSAGDDTSFVSRTPLLILLYNLFGFPDFLFEIVIPWGRAAPRLGVAIGIAAAAAIVLSGLQRERLGPDLRLTLFLFLILLGGAAASNPPRHETRYVFFLFPLAITLLLALLCRGLNARRDLRLGTAGVCSLAVALLFVVTEDTGARESRALHRLHEAPAALFPPSGSGHLVGRADNRSAAAWLATHARAGQDLLVNASPGVDFYFPGFDYTYIDWTQQRFMAYSCDQGHRERWGNRPLLYTHESLREAVGGSPRSLIVASATQSLALRRDALRGFAPRVVFTTADGKLQVLEIRRASP